MRVALSVAFACLLACVTTPPAAMPAQVSQPQSMATDPNRGFEAGSPLESRMGGAPDAIVRQLKDAGLPAPTTHVLSDVEMKKLSAAFAMLPPLHQRVLRDRLHSISFLDGLPNNALTSTVESGAPYKTFDIIIRAGVLNETISEIVTRKERTCFDAAGSPLNVSINAGNLDAIVYVLTHEASHIVDSSLDITSHEGAEDPAKDVAMTPFTKGIWINRITPIPRYDSPLLAGSRYRSHGKALPVAEAQALYASLSKSPFASLYGSSNWHDDFAELVTWYHLTQKLHQPYQIQLRDANKLIYTYEPMKSPLVTSRLCQIQRVYQESQVTPARC
ncbi:hypothetical protein FHW69_002794 [Luteibacter sp. Sphag1AF]|uniref:hypothetical protein n=1 Tax=Luteibacter sp. Sphag1AF TaxID=2587031 RepID=UPI00161DE72E|nr:hypothetical protein [Luteibacter sp. Sphag1AF]MBB3228159.1 hypothetical protein [Luteibacter sp. Sphag1AF]